MLSSNRMEEFISLILLIGIIISTILVSLGGFIYLIQHGSDALQTEMLQSEVYQTSFKKIMQGDFSFSSLGLIEFGLLSLVLTQVLRVALLAWFYITSRDYWFTCFSLFILLVLVYSIFIR